MLLTTEERERLVNVRHNLPHQLLGMHRLGDGSGLVVRVLAPGAASVAIAPVHEPDKPEFSLERVDDAGAP